MPFPISGNINKIKQESLKDFSKRFGIILSEKQMPAQQYQMIHNALFSCESPNSILGRLDRNELISFIFLLTQFGDITLFETPAEYTQYTNNPYILNWADNCYMVPLEVMEFLSKEKIFRDQKYLFALIPGVSLKEKKEWIKWIGADYQGEYEKDLNFEIYHNLRPLQKVFQGKALVSESEFELEKIWPRGKREIVDWFYKGFTSFYYSMHELAKQEKDPFYAHILAIIKAGKYILQRDFDRYSGEEKYKLVATIEGNTPQLRETIFKWEEEREYKKNELFQSVLKNGN